MLNTRNAVIVLAVSLSACADDGGNRRSVVVDGPQPYVAKTPIDGPFAVTVEERALTCVETATGIGQTTTYVHSPAVNVDVFAHPFDGLYDFIAGDGAVLPVLRDVRVARDGLVELTQDVGDGKTATVLGTVHDDEFVLRVSVTNTATPGYSCTETAVLSGARRPVADPDAIDGIYDAVTGIGAPRSCPVTDEAVRTASSIVDVADLGDGWVGVSGQGFGFTAELGDDGSFADSREVTDVTGHYVEVTSTQRATGTLVAGGGTMTVDKLYVNASGAECGQRATLALTKRLPDPALPQNDYRAETVIDVVGCGFEPETANEVVRVSVEPDGSLRLRDGTFTRGIVIAPDADGNFLSVLREFATDGEDLSVAGTVGGGRISYAVTLDDGTCSGTMTTNGLLRFVATPAEN